MNHKFVDRPDCNRNLRWQTNPDTISDSVNQFFSFHLLTIRKQRKTLLHLNLPLFMRALFFLLNKLFYQAIAYCLDNIRSNIICQCYQYRSDYLHCLYIYAALEYAGTYLDLCHPIRYFIIILRIILYCYYSNILRISSFIRTLSYVSYHSIRYFLAQ